MKNDRIRLLTTDGVQEVFKDLHQEDVAAILMTFLDQGCDYFAGIECCSVEAPNVEKAYNIIDQVVSEHELRFGEALYVLFYLSRMILTETMKSAHENDESLN